MKNLRKTIDEISQNLNFPQIREKICQKPAPFFFLQVVAEILHTHLFNGIGAVSKMGYSSTFTQ